MNRQIIRIDEELCTGCGECSLECPEGAIQIIDGKARLVGDLLCDGLGACIGTCPEGAIIIEEREAEPYDEDRVMDNLVSLGENTIIAHLNNLRDHQQRDYVQQALQYLTDHSISVNWTGCVEEGSDFQNRVHQLLHSQDHDHHQEIEFSGCPGSRMIDLRSPTQETKTNATEEIPSELRNWPVQIKLAPIQAPYYDDADLLIASDCVSYAYANFHSAFIAGKTLLIGCPKLDDTQLYIEKLAQIFANNPIRSIQIVRMEVPCCSGMNYIVEQALQLAGKTGIIPVTHNIISIQGIIQE